MDIAGLIPSFGGLFFTILAFVIALSVIVAIHEYGHYIIVRARSESDICEMPSPSLPEAASASPMNLT